MENQLPTLLRPFAAAKFLGLSRVSFWRAAVAGRVPAAVRLGGTGGPMYRREELAAWVAAGCPPRARWAWPQRDVMGSPTGPGPAMTAGDARQRTRRSRGPVPNAGAGAEAGAQPRGGVGNEGGGGDLRTE